MLLITIWVKSFRSLYISAFITITVILDFRNLKFLTVGTVKSVELRHLAKFRRNRSKRDQDMSVLILC